MALLWDKNARIIVHVVVKALSVTWLVRVKFLP